MPRLLGALCSDQLTPRQHLEQQQALFKQFAQILDFVLAFDDLKVGPPNANKPENISRNAFLAIIVIIDQCL